MARLCRQWRRSPLLRPSSELPLAPWGPLGSFEVAPGQTEWQSVKSWCGERRGEWMRMEGFLPRANEEIFKDVKSVKKVLATSDSAFKTSERGDNTWQYSNSKKRNGFFGSPKSQFKSLYLWPLLTCNARRTCRGVSTCQCTDGPPRSDVSSLLATGDRLQGALPSSLNTTPCSISIPSLCPRGDIQIMTKIHNHKREDISQKSKHLRPPNMQSAADWRCCHIIWCHPMSYVAPWWFECVLWYALICFDVSRTCQNSAWPCPDWLW